MDWEIVAPMIVMVTGIVTAGGVLVLRPISKRLAELLAVMAQQKSGGSSELEAARLREVVSSLESRLALLEERQNFTENLLTSRRDPQPLPQGERIRTV